MRQPVKRECPDAARHTKAPTDYVGWHMWATRKSRTHKQVHCPGCGRLEIWVPKQPKGTGNGQR